MKSCCPATTMFNRLRAKFSERWSSPEKEPQDICPISCFTGKVSEKILMKLDTDKGYRQEIRNGLIKELSILFVDIRDFSTRTAKMPPERIVTLLNMFIPEMLNVILEKYQGTVDKLLGDGILAVYGHPYESGEDIVRAIYSAIDMQQVSAAMAEVLSLSGMEPIEIGIGVNCGEVLICEIGDERYREVTVIGAPVNIAAKMEDVAGHGEIVLPKDALPIIEKLKPKLADYFDGKGHHHGVDVVSLNWTDYIRNQQHEVDEWSIQ
jgi:class 3 adenylate cyclase